MASQKLELRKFDGSLEKWGPYRFHLSAFLKAHSLNVIVHNQQNNIPQALPQGTHTLLNQTYGSLIQSLSGRALEVVRSVGTELHLAISALDRIFNSQNASTRLQVLQDLLGMKFDEKKESMESFIANKRNLVKERLQGRFEADEVILLSILGNLPTSYETLVAPMLVQATPDIDAISNTLVEFAQQREGKQREDEHVLLTKVDKKKNDVLPVAIAKAIQAQFDKMSKGGKKGKGKGKGKNKGVQKKFDKVDYDTCRNCGRKGHWAQDCWSAPKNPANKKE